MGENSLLCCSEGVQLCAFPLNLGPLGGVAVLLWWFGSLWVGKALQTCCHTDRQQRRVVTQVLITRMCTYLSLHTCVLLHFERTAAVQKFVVLPRGLLAKSFAFQLEPTCRQGMLRAAAAYRGENAALVQRSWHRPALTRKLL